MNYLYLADTKYSELNALVTTAENNGITEPLATIKKSNSILRKARATWAEHMQEFALKADVFSNKLRGSLAKIPQKLHEITPYIIVVRQFPSTIKYYANSYLQLTPKEYFRYRLSGIVPSDIFTADDWDILPASIFRQIDPYILPPVHIQEQVLFTLEYNSDNPHHLHGVEDILMVGGAYV